MQLASGEKPKQEDRGGDRVLCDSCGTGIADLYRCCKTCGVDVCLRCCAKRRAANGEVRLPVLALCCSPCSLHPPYPDPVPLLEGLRHGHLHALLPALPICYPQYYFTYVLQLQGVWSRTI